MNGKEHPDASASTHEYATLGGGCFWCVEAALNQLEGVSEAVSGYAGGRVDHPNYSHKTPLTGETRRALMADLASD